MRHDGDVAVMTSDDPVRILGRHDQQPGTRGYRVGPGAVEAVIARVDGVRDVAVIQQEHPLDGRRLVAFVVASTPLSGPRIRRQVAAVLPGYAVPSLVLQVAELPLTASGKVDRRALASRPARERPAVSTLLREPGSDLELQLAALWSELLGMPEIGVDDDFFELGGHSLLAIRITRHIAEAYDVEIDPRAFYDNPTVAELARLMEEPATEDGQTAR